MKIVADAKNAFANGAFSRLGELLVLETQEITARTLADADAVVVRSETRVNRELLEGTAVRFVGTATIGTDHVDLDYLRRRGIAFAHAPGSNANSVAEYLAAALLVVSGRLDRPLEGMSIAVIGVGNVGSRVERMARALGMEVMVNDPPLARATGDPRYLPLDEVIGADVVTFHVPLTRDGRDPTYHMADASLIARMKPGAVFVNTSRGAVAETGALSAALASGALAGAVLDVWEGEPAIDWTLVERATIGTPHIAGYSLDGKVRAARMIFERIREVFALPAGWPEDLALPEPARPRLALDATGQSVQAAVREAVRHAYDIERDHGALAAARDDDERHRAERFRGLRASYPDRREFGATTVELRGGDRRLESTLHALGFRLTQR